MAELVDMATQTSEIGSDEELDDPILLQNNVGIASPRVVIDTSPPFVSVEEAVTRFGGRGFWIPRPFLPPHASPPPPPHHHDLCDVPAEPDISKLEDRAAVVLKDLHKKEQETIEILKELELTKQLVEELKLKLPREEPPECMQIPCLDFNSPMPTPTKNDPKKTDPVDEHSNSFPTSTAGLIMMELKQAKLNLFQSTNDLAAIRASVESLSKKMEREKDLVEKATINLNEARPNVPVRNDGEKINPLVISRELRELNYEAEQFMKTAEAARSEVLKAMSDIEQTKTGLKVIEMRWFAAKKLEEAARATESLALAEIRALSSNENTVFEGYHQQKPARISLSIEEYSALTDKARRAESLFKRKDLDESFRKMEEATEEKLSKMSLEEVLGRVDVMNRRKLSADPVPAQRRPPPRNAHSDFRNSFQPRPPQRDPRLLDANEFEFMKNNKHKPELRQTTSIGEILSRKLVLRDDLTQEEAAGGRQRVSLNQMLRQHRGETSPLQRRDQKDGGEPEQKKFSKRKGLRFVHISLPLSKHTKNKIQALNLW